MAIAKSGGEGHGSRSHGEGSGHSGGGESHGSRSHGVEFHGVGNNGTPESGGGIKNNCNKDKIYVESYLCFITLVMALHLIN